MEVTSSAMVGMDGLQWKEQMLSKDSTKQEQVGQLAQEFEGIFIRQFLDKALTPMDPESGLFGAKGSPMIEHLIKDSLASSITAAGSLGFKSVLQAQLFPETLNTEEGTASHE